MHEPEPNDARPFLPERRSLKALREAALGCRGCHLWQGATQIHKKPGTPRGGRLPAVARRAFTADIGTLWRALVQDDD